MTEAIFNKMFSGVGSSFSGAVSEFNYTLSAPAAKQQTNQIIRGFYKNESMFKNTMEIASKYFSGITLSSKFVNKECKEKVYIELEVEHIYPEIERYRESLTTLLSQITLPTDEKTKNIVSLLKPSNGTGPSLKTFGIDLSASFLFGDILDPETNKASIEYSTIEEENGLTFYGYAGFDEHKFEFNRKYILCLCLDMGTKRLSCQIVSKESVGDIPKTIFYSYSQTIPNLTQYTGSSEGDVIFQISTGYLHYELLTFLNSSPAKYKAIIEQYAKYFKSAGTTVKINSTSSSQLYRPADCVAIADCTHTAPVDVSFKTPNFLLAGRSQYSKKDVIQSSVKFSEDTGNAITDKVKDLITNKQKQKITGRLDYSMKPGERFFLSVDDGKSWTEVKESGFTGRQFTSPEINLSLASSRISFKYIDKYGQTVNCKTSVQYAYQPNALDHTIEVESIFGDAGGFKTRFYIQTINCKFSKKFDTDCLVEGSVDNGKTFRTIPPENISPDRMKFVWKDVGLSEGINNVCFRTVDIAGNVGAKTGIKQIFVKTQIPRNIAQFEPFLYRYGAKLPNGTPYSYSDWYETVWRFYKSSTESDFYLPFAMSLDKVNIQQDKTREEYFPVPTTSWEIPEPERVRTFTNTATGFPQSHRRTNYKDQNMVCVLSFPIQEGERVLGSVDGKSWVDLTEHVYPYKELANAIKNYKTSMDRPLVSTTLGYKYTLAYAPYTGDVKIYAEEQGKVFTSGGEYSSIGGSFAELKRYTAEGYTKEGYSSIGGDDSEISMNGSRSGRSRADLGTPILKEIEPVKEGQAVVIWNKMQLAVGKNNLQLKIVDLVGNESIVGSVEYTYKPDISPISVTDIQISGSIKREGDKFYFINSAFNPDGTQHEAIVTFSRDLTEEESVETFRPARATSWTNGTSSLYLKTEKIAPNKIKISPIFVGNMFGGTIFREDGGKADGIQYENYFFIVVGDTAGNVYRIPNTYIISIKNVVSTDILITSISEDTEILGDFRTSVSNQDISFSVIGSLSQEDEVSFSLNGSSWIKVTPTTVVNEKNRKFVVRGIVLVYGENTLRVKISDSLGNEKIKEQIAVLEDPISINVKIDIGQGNFFARYFTANVIDLPFEYSGPTIAYTDKFYGSVDNGKTWVEFNPVRNVDSLRYNYLWKNVPLNNGVSADHVISIKMFSGSRNRTFYSNVPMEENKFRYACNAGSFLNVTWSITGNLGSLEIYKPTTNSNGMIDGVLVSTITSSVFLRASFNATGEANFSSSNKWRVYKDDTSFIEGDWTQGQDFQVGLDWTPAFGELAVELIGNIKFVYPSSNGTTTKYLNNISLTQKFAPTPSYVFNTTQQTVSGSEGFKQHFRSAYLPGGSVLAIRETYMETPIVVNIDWSNLDTSNWSKRPDYY